MNERIKELIEQIGMFQEQDTDGKRFMAMHETNLQKFAALLWDAAYDAGFNDGCNETILGG